MYKGIIIAESLMNPEIINKLRVYKIEISEKDEEIPRENRKTRWHLYWVKIGKKQIEEISGNIKEGWYAHFWQGKDIIVIFKDKKFKINFDDKLTWKDAVDYGKSLGIPEEQLDFLIEEVEGEK